MRRCNQLLMCVGIYDAYLVLFLSVMELDIVVQTDRHTALYGGVSR